jgi:hypothetical protein
MQGGKNWFWPKEMNENRFFWDSHWLEIWSNHFYPSMGPNGGSVAMDSAFEISRSCPPPRVPALDFSAILVSMQCLQEGYQLIYFLDVKVAKWAVSSLAHSSNPFLVL